VSKQTKFFQDKPKIALKLPKLSNPLVKLNVSNPLIMRLAIIFSLLLFALSAYHIAFARRIIPGVKIGSVTIGGKNYVEAKKALEDYEKGVDKKVLLKFEDRTFEFKGQDVALQYNWDASISRAYEIGRTGNILIDARDKLAGLFKTLYLPAFYDYDEDLFHAKFSEIRGEVNIEGKDARYIIAAPGQLDITEAVEGRNVDSENLFKIIIGNFERVNFTENELPVERNLPKITKLDIESFRDQVKKVINNPLLVIYGKKQTKLDPPKMLDLLSFAHDGDDIHMKLNAPKYEAFLDTIANEVNQSPRGNVTQVMELE
jgi:hypothetical protein